MSKTLHLALLLILSTFSLIAAEPARPAVIGHRGMLQAAPRMPWPPSPGAWRCE
jgi:hypothetical protein